MTVAVGCHLDRGVAETGLYQFERQFEAAVRLPVDAPRRVEVTQRVQALVLGLALLVDHASLDLRGLERAPDDVREGHRRAGQGREGEVEAALGRGDFPLA